MSQDNTTWSDDQITSSQKISVISDELLAIAERLINLSLILKSISIKYANRPHQRSIGVSINPDESV